MEDSPVRKGTELIEYLSSLHDPRLPLSSKLVFSPVRFSGIVKDRFRRFVILSATNHPDGPIMFAYDIDLMHHVDCVLECVSLWTLGWYAKEGIYAHPELSAALLSSVSDVSEAGT